MKKSNKTISIIAFALFGVVILALVFKKKLVEYITKTSPQKTISELTTSLSQGNQDLKKELLELVQQKIENSTKQIVNQNGNNIILKGIGWKRTIAMQNIARGHVVRITENAGIDQCYTYDPLDIENYGLATGISLLLFYAFAMQCISTLAITKKETNSWKWPMIQLAFMSGLAYTVSLIVYQILK